ncbi:hypothetical protein ACFLWC_05770 [Chloroflexota bacterium]
MAKKKDVGDRLEKAQRENRTLVLKYLNLKFNGASLDYKRGFEEGVKFCKEFPNAGIEMIRYFERTELDQ